MFNMFIIQNCFFAISLQSPFIHFDLWQLPSLANKTPNSTKIYKFESCFIKTFYRSWSIHTYHTYIFLYCQHLSAQVWSLKSEWFVYVLVLKCHMQWFSMTGIMESHWRLIKDLKCEQFLKFTNLWKVVEHCGLLAQVSKAGLTSVCNRGFYSTNLSPKSGKCRKNKRSQILPDIPYQTSMKPQQTSSPGVARSSAARLVRGKGTSTKAYSNHLCSYIWWSHASNCHNVEYMKTSRCVAKYVEQDPEHGKNMHKCSTELKSRGAWAASIPEKMPRRGLSPCTGRPMSLSANVHSILE